MSKNRRIELTPTEQRFLRVLSDGEPHRREELIAALPDAKFSTMNNVQFHLNELRKKLQPIGEDIVCVFMYRSFLYRHIKHLKPGKSPEYKPRLPQTYVAPST